MADRKPLVIIDGVWQQIPANDATAVDAVKFSEASTVPIAAAQLYWCSTTETLVCGTSEAGLSVAVVENTFKVKNTSGSTITKMQVVRPTGASGDIPTVSLANADIFMSSRPVGIIRSASISNNGIGYVTTFGRVDSLDTSAFAEGVVLYLSSTAGEMVATTPPAYPAYPVRVGVVARSHATEGIVIVDSNPEHDLDQDLSIGSTPLFSHVNKVKTLTAGENLVDGNLCYLKSDGKMWKASRSATTTIAGFLAICTETIATDNTGGFHYSGVYTTTGLTIGNILFIHTTVGEWTGTKPSATGNLIRIIGYALSATELEFNPDGLYFEVG